MTRGLLWASRTALSSLAALLIFVGYASAGHVEAIRRAHSDQDKGAPKQQQVGEAESKAAMKVQSAPDPNAKLQAAADFVKKYPKSTLRSQVALHVAGEINNIQNAGQKVTLLENLLNIFKEPGEADVITPMLIDAYIHSEPPRTEDAVRLANSFLARNPNDLATLTQITILGVQQAKSGNSKGAQQSLQAGQKAIELIEAGKKPDNMDDARWKEYQTRWLPQLYTSTGTLALISGNRDEARTRIQKAVSLNSSDPYNFWLLASLVYDEYQKLAEEHNSLASGPLKDEVLKKAQAVMDSLIDNYARVVALSEGQTQYNQLREQAMTDLQKFWTYRHGGSTDGMQQLIDKYKKH
ncbi:MAG TPA: hypothetical protein VKM94_17265 [Blastocatellia bacterium]|nr:hypothetical protein [Blastocatellia bacterium]